MKILLLKYICLPIICVTSGYSFIYLNNQTELLHENILSKKTKKAKQIYIHNPKNNSTKLVIIDPPKDTTEDQKQKKEEYVAKDKNMLPDVEFLNFIIDKGKEGIPVLKFNNVFASILNF